MRLDDLYDQIALFELTERDFEAKVLKEFFSEIFNADELELAKADRASKNKKLAKNYTPLPKPEKKRKKRKEGYFFEIRSIRDQKWLYRVKWEDGKKIAHMSQNQVVWHSDRPDDSHDVLYAAHGGRLSRNRIAAILENYDNDIKPEYIAHVDYDGTLRYAAWVYIFLWNDDKEDHTWEWIYIAAGDRVNQQLTAIGSSETSE